MQDWGIQDPLEVAPIMAGKSYPPNIATQLPVERLEILTTDYNGSSNPTLLTCRARFPMRVVYIFKRDIWQDFRSIPLGQVENLLFRASALMVLYSTQIDPDIISINIPLQENPLIVRPASDVTTDAAFANDWAVIFRTSIDTTFTSDISEYTPLDWVDIQPAIFPQPDDGEQPDIDINPFNLKELRIEVNRSHYPEVSPLYPETFELDELIILKEPTNNGVT